MSVLLYNRQNPFLASVKERFSLTKPGSRKNTQHLVLDLKGSGITYRVGDSIGVFRKHDLQLGEKTLEALKASGKELIKLKQSQDEISFVDFLTAKANITEVSQKLFRAVLARQTNREKKEYLEFLTQEAHYE